MENTQPARTPHAQPNPAIPPLSEPRDLAVILIVVFWLDDTATPTWWDGLGNQGDCVRGFEGLRCWSGRAR